MSIYYTESMEAHRAPIWATLWGCPHLTEAMEAEAAWKRV